MRRLALIFCLLASPAAAEIDPCIVGVWRLQSPDMTSFWSQMAAPMQVETVSVNGAAQVGADGMLQMVMSNGYGRMSNAGIAFEARFDGRFAAQAESQGNQLRSEIVDALFNFEVRMITADGTNPVMQQVQNGMETVEERVNVHSYVCTDTTLQLRHSSGEPSPFDNWVRQ